MDYRLNLGEKRQEVKQSSPILKLCQTHYTIESWVWVTDFLYWCRM